MTNLACVQLSLIADVESIDLPLSDWGWENERTGKLGTKNLLVPNFPSAELGTKNLLVPNFPEWTLPIGCLQQKWIKDRKYWYWRYYDNRGKKASLYLGKDYNKAIAKVKKIGIPADAKIPKSSRPTHS